MVTPVRIGIPGTTQFLDGTTVTQTTGPAIREGVFIADPTTLAARAAVADCPPSRTDYGVVTRPAFDQAMFDAFGRLRVSNPSTIFDSSQEYTFHPLLFDHVTAGGGTATYTQATNSTTLSTVATTSGNRAMRQTKVYWRYQPGKSQLVKITAIPKLSGTPGGTSRCEMGYFDDGNGVFFRVAAGGNYMVVRTNTTGSVVDTPILQSSWNIDPLDGTGDSGITLDITSRQILVIDLQWLGVGRVRVGFQINGALYYCHEFLHANNTPGTGVYMRTANLPVRWQVFNEGGVGAIVSMMAVCVEIESEGGVQDSSGYTNRAGVAGVPVSCANTVALTPVFSIRLVDTFAGLTYRGHVIPQSIEGLIATNSCYWQMIWNPSTLTGATFANSADATYSGVEFDTAATVVSGGTVMASGYFAAGSGSNRLAGSAGLASKLLLARTYANTRDIITFAARGVGGASSVAAELEFKELY